MAKRLIYISLILVNGLLLWQGIRLYRQWHALLQSRGLDGPALLGLIFFGIFTLMMPLTIRSRWDQFTPGGMVREYVVRGGMILGALTAVVLAFTLIIFVVTIPARLGRGALILPWLFILVPLAVTLVDLYKGSYARTLRNLALGFGLYSFRIYGLLGIQFAVIAVGFVLGPAGVFLQLMGLGDMVARWGFDYFVSERPLLCTWANVGEPFCNPLLLTFHLLHPLLLWLAVRTGDRAFNAASDQYHMVVDTLSGWLQT